MDSLTENILERGGCPLHYWYKGEPGKPLIVLTHGATIDHLMFDPQLPILLNRYSILVWDMRGHGKSRPMGDDFTVPGAVDDLVAILAQIAANGDKTTPTVFVGQSTGGYVVQELVFRYPERVTALVMIDCACITLKFSAMDKFLLKISPPLLKLYPDQMLRRQAAEQSSIKPDVQDYIYKASNMLSKADYINVITGVTQCLHEEPNYRIEQPILLVHGEKDKLGSIARDAAKWAARDPHCKLVVIPDAGHTANQDNPAAFNKTLLEFLAQIERK